MKFFLLLSLLLVPVVSSAKIKVVTTLPVYASLAQAVGGEKIEIISLTNEGMDPHFIDAKPSLIVHLADADALIHSGLELESGWLPTLLSQARNSNLAPQSQGNINLALALTKILDVPAASIDRSQGDIHSSGNPHAWLDPRRALEMAKFIADHLTKLDPAHAEIFNQSLAVFTKSLKEAENNWLATLKPFQNQRIITYHKSLNYFCDFSGLICSTTLESKPGIPPNTRKLSEIISQHKKEKFLALMQENFYPDRYAQDLSREINVPVILLNTQPKQKQEFVVFMNQLVNDITKNLGKVEHE